MKPSDPRYADMEALVTMRAVLTNPHMHLIGYVPCTIADDELAEAIKEVDKAQAELLILGDE